MIQAPSEPLLAFKIALIRLLHILLLKRDTA